MLKADVGGNIATFVYNADGVRVQQSNEGGTIDYEVDVIAPLPLVMQDGTNSYVYGLDLIAAIDGSANEVYYLYDGLGSVAALTDDSGTVTDTYVYDAFGAVTSSTGTTSNEWLFTGEQRDGDTELYFLRARYYDPEIGRFLGRDPIEFAQRYGYAGSNPATMTDPSGLYDAIPAELGLLNHCMSRFESISSTSACNEVDGGGPIGELLDRIAGSVSDSYNLQGQGPGIFSEEWWSNPSCSVLLLNSVSLGASTVAARGALSAVVVTSGVASSGFAVAIDMGTGNLTRLPLDIAVLRIGKGSLTASPGMKLTAKYVGGGAWALSGFECVFPGDRDFSPGSGTRPPLWPLD